MDADARRSLPLRGLLLVLCAAGCAGPAAAPARIPGTLELRCGVAAFAETNPLADIDTLAAWGADYAEIALSKAAALSDEDFAAAKRKVDASRIRVEAANWFVPGDVKLTGPAADPAKTRAYLEKALARAEALGVKVVVFGSPGARSVPDGFPMSQAWAQLRAFLGQCADVIEGHGYGMIIAIEPLRRQESNIVNTAAEGLKLAREVGRPQVRLHVDFYHLAVENENPDILLEAKDYVVHLHIAEPKERLLVRDASQDPRLGAFFANLKAIGYRGRISVEGNVKDAEADIRAGLKFLRAMAETYR
jgi:D-psicose/D-tagatose/L-ribulose 3-epimerase